MSIIGVAAEELSLCALARRTEPDKRLEVDEGQWQLAPESQSA
jgi:hypothetical protein